MTDAQDRVDADDEDQELDLDDEPAAPLRPVPLAVVAHALAACGHVQLGDRRRALTALHRLDAAAAELRRLALDLPDGDDLT